MRSHIHSRSADADHRLRSFFLTPLNYFDADVSMESTNAILLTPPAVAGDDWEYNDYGVSSVHCAPPPVPPFNYYGVSVYGLDGQLAPPESAEEMRKASDMYHRIKLEL